MTYYDNWSGFLQEARSLFCGRPLKTRYSVKYVKGEKCLVLKVTDDRKCCMFKLSRQGNLRQLQQFNQLFLNWSLSRDTENPEALPLKVTAAKPKSNRKVNARNS
ncbi:signal recognition particle SRP9 subunit, putative [Babesia bigemina]|uniref:Signal recognition particle SRP9 subunit, putative n=1 Tax=Babesia bigemina TaxID=5866 RepID=A0A061D180_BABBI|nr:signal recognition particle SRP9 subunit, putative [Babesia bigemina]CDR94388.1 signal recognition particle SRP9 subunit, putative [Babesia bigemina]|eukprot:XP_012766574.1 signal recognition particle SRP9 subunit, putative [Babesia bigemina]